MTAVAADAQAFPTNLDDRLRWLTGDVPTVDKSRLPCCSTHTPTASRAKRKWPADAERVSR